METLNQEVQRVAVEAAREAVELYFQPFRWAWKQIVAMLKLVFRPKVSAVEVYESQARTHALRSYVEAERDNISKELREKLMEVLVERDDKRDEIVRDFLAKLDDESMDVLRYRHLIYGRPNRHYTISQFRIFWTAVRQQPQIDIKTITHDDGNIKGVELRAYGATILDDQGNVTGVRLRGSEREKGKPLTIFLPIKRARYEE